VKKVLVILVLSLCLVGITQAKDKGKMAVGANVVLSLPMGDLGDAYKMGFGGTATFTYRIAKQIDLTGTAGYITYGVDSDKIDGSYSTIPILFGGRYYFMPGKVQPYGTAELGLHFTSADVEIPSQTFGGFTIGGGSQSVSATEFGFGFGGGVLVALSKSANIDGTVQLNFIGGELTLSIEAGASFAIN
jgi:hypothetical protein